MKNENRLLAEEGGFHLLNWFEDNESYSSLTWLHSIPFSATLILNTQSRGILL